MSCLWERTRAVCLSQEEERNVEQRCRKAGSRAVPSHSAVWTGWLPCPHVTEGTQQPVEGCIDRCVVPKALLWPEARGDKVSSHPW